METVYNSTRLSQLLGTVYAELVNELLILRRQLRAELPPGTLTTKTVRGNTYWYVQYAELGHRRQVYLGPDSDDLRARIEELRRRWEDAEADARRAAQLAGQLRAGGVHVPDAQTGRVLEVLQTHGMFDVGVVLVGSLAFTAYEPMLGVRWGEGWRTADVDLAAEPDVQLAVPAPADLKAALDATGLPFDAIPALDPGAPSTSFKVRRQQLTVDLVTPEVGPASPGPVPIPQLGVAAHPLRFLDFLIEHTEHAALATRRGIFVNVPNPARYAVHKLIVASRRPATWQTKAQKDLSQAGQLLEVLCADRPSDVRGALREARGRGPKWRAAIDESLEKLPGSVQALVRAT